MAKKRSRLTIEEKTLKAIQSLFILNALQLKIKGHTIRKILGVAMKNVTSVAKAMKKIGKAKN